MSGYPAAVYRGPGDIVMEERARPEPGPGQVLVRVGVCGICGSDATEYSRGPVLTQPPVVLGHEFAGTVEQVGTGVDDLAPGMVVAAGAGVACGECRMCRRGRTNLCASYHTLGLQRDGGLAGYVLAPASTLFDVTAHGLAMDTLGLTQPMSIAVHTVRRSRLEAGMDAVIVGVGGIGSFITVAASAVGARVLVIDREPARLELALRLGAHASLLAGEQSISDRLAELGMAPDVLFEGGAKIIAGGIAGERSPERLEHLPQTRDIRFGSRTAVIAASTHHDIGLTHEDLRDGLTKVDARPWWSTNLRTCNAFT